VHSLSRRSFHRARSGLLALRAGVLRRSTVEGEEFEIDSDEPISASLANPTREIQGQFHSSGAYSSSTQEDLGFGIDMYRMSAPPSSPISDTRLESTFSSTNDAFNAETPRSPRTLSAPFTSLPECESQMCPESNCNETSEQDQQRVSKTHNSSASSEMTPKSHGSHNTADIADDGISESSADCLFAFPGIYQEMLEQWARERQDETPQVPQVNVQPPCIVLQDAPCSHPPSYQISEEFNALGWPIIGMDRSELPETQGISPDIPDTDEEQPLFSLTSTDGEMSDRYLEEAYDPIPKDGYSSDTHMSLLSASARTWVLI
jgi:hypothetical protein